MGWLSDWFGAGYTERCAKTWRSTFDPGSNPNMDKQGRDYIDHVNDPKASPSVWDEICKSDELRRRSFDTMDADKDGRISREEMAAALAPAGFSASVVSRAMDEAGVPASGMDPQQYAAFVQRRSN